MKMLFMLAVYLCKELQSHNLLTAVPQIYPAIAFTNELGFRLTVVAKLAPPASHHLLVLLSSLVWRIMST